MSDLVGGLHAVLALIESHADAVESLWLQANRKDKRLLRIRQLAQARGLVCHECSRAQLDERAQGLRHQGALAMARASVAANEQDLLALLAQRDSPLVLVLDGVTDPHNLGACLRSADAAGVDAVVVPKDRAVGLTPVVSKVACGAAQRLPFFQVTNLSRVLAELADAGFWLVGAAGEAEQSLYEADLTGPLAMVMGAEGSGLRKLTKQRCQQLVRIPMHGSVASLNVSVATGVCLFEARRQRS